MLPAYSAAVILIMKIKHFWQAVRASKRTSRKALLSIAAMMALPAIGAQAPAPAMPKEVLGNILFNDLTLSNPVGQSCASCHKPEGAFADPGMAASEGAIKGVFGNRNTPTLLYASMTIPFEELSYEKGWQGGLFWDGRANTLQEQALGPLLNPIEMNNTVEGLAKKLRATSYYGSLKAVYGEALDTSDQAAVDAAADALAVFQQTEQFQPFTSKFDYAEFDLVELTQQEFEGHHIFQGKGMCIDCHSGRFDGDDLFSSYRHHNIRVPVNPELAFYTQPKSVNPEGKAFIDIGLGLNTRLTAEDQKLARGLFRSPSLRNIALTPPYMHNGVFKTLEEVIDFYNDIDSKGPPELSENMSSLLSTPLELTEQEKAALIAFLKTLTDGYEVPAETYRTLKAKRKERAELLAAQEAEYLKAEQERLKAEEARLKASGG